MSLDILALYASPREKQNVVNIINGTRYRARIRTIGLNFLFVLSGILTCCLSFGLRAWFMGYEGGEYYARSHTHTIELTILGA